MPEIVDLIVVGAGAGGMTASVVAARSGLRVLLVESSEYVGGTSALSGGISWIPGNPLMSRSGKPDSRDAAIRYLRNVAGNRYRSNMIDAYLDNGPRMVEFLLRETEVEFQIIPYPDYMPYLDGAVESGRSIGAVPYDGRRLGDKLGMLRPPLSHFSVFGTLTVDYADVPHFMNATKSLASFKHVARLTGRYFLDRLSGQKRGTRLTLGNALAGRLFRSCLDAGVEIWTKARAMRLIQADGRVVGLAVEKDGAEVTVTARRGVVLASGGFANDPDLQKSYYPNPDAHPTMTVPTNRGDGYRMGAAAGAAIGDEVFQSFLGMPLSKVTLNSGKTWNALHSNDRNKPGTLCVNASGRRFINEALPYNMFTEQMLASGAEEAFIICGRGFIRKYGFGPIKAGPAWMRPLKPFLDSGYLIKADSLAELARKLGIDPATLESTVRRFDENAAKGIDPDFNKGDDAFQRMGGDPSHKPNPCLGPLGPAPYYAIRFFAGDLGTFVGLKTNEEARVLDRHDRPIDGLFACGLDSYHVMAGTYPGGGSSIGPSMVMGYVAARTAAKAAAAFSADAA